MAGGRLDDGRVSPAGKLNKQALGFGAELAARISEELFYDLEAPVLRATGFDTPYPHDFEWEYFIGPARVAAAMRRALEG